MSSTDSFFRNLIGIHDMSVNGGSLLPRRHRLNFVRGLVADVDDTTQVTIAVAPVWMPTFGMIADFNDFTEEGFSGASEVPFEPLLATRTLTGFESTDLTVFEKRIWNFTTDASDLVITNDDSASAPGNRVLTNTGSSITITPGNAVKLIRSANNANWLALPCLI